MAAGVFIMKGDAMEPDDERPLFVGICRGSEDGNDYVITAEYLDGYVVLGAYRTLVEARAALPRQRWLVRVGGRRKAVRRAMVEREDGM